MPKVGFEPTRGCPYRRMGLLDRQHPGVHGTVLVVLTSPSKGTRSGPRLDNQVVALLEPLSVVYWLVLLVQLSIPMPLTNPEMMRPLGMTSNMAISSARRTGLSDVGSMLPNINILAREVARARKPPVMLFLHVHARRGIVVLVYHQSIEALLFRVLVLVQVPLEQIMGLIRVEVGIGEDDGQTARVFCTNCGASLRSAPTPRGSRSLCAPGRHYEQRGCHYGRCRSASAPDRGIHNSLVRSVVSKRITKGFPNTNKTVGFRHKLSSYRSIFL